MANQATDLRQEKNRLRRQARQIREQAAIGSSQASMQAAEQFLKEININPHSVISAYSAVGSELDPMPLINALDAMGISICLPVAQASQEPLCFVSWRPGEPIAQGVYGENVPQAGNKLVPDILIVPLLAWDKQGNRLGYGGGYYDRTLAHLRKRGNLLALGYAYEDQHCRSLPHEATDERLDAIITERFVHFVKG